MVAHAELLHLQGGVDLIAAGCLNEPLEMPRVNLVFRIAYCVAGGGVLPITKKRGGEKDRPLRVENFLGMP